MAPANNKKTPPPAKPVASKASPAASNIKQAASCSPSKLKLKLSKNTHTSPTKTSSQNSLIKILTLGTQHKDVSAIGFTIHRVSRYVPPPSPPNTRDPSLSNHANHNSPLSSPMTAPLTPAGLTKLLLMRPVHPLSSSLSSECSAQS